MAEPFNINFSDGGEIQKITFSGLLVINHIEKIIDSAKEKISFDKSIEIEISDCENIDITFIQFLIALQKTWLQAGLEFSVKAVIKDDLIRLVENAGFINVLK
jgi:hypothetical protein